MKRQKVTPVKVEKVVEVVTEEKREIIEEVGGLETLLGKRVMLMCSNYFYSGTLVGVNTTCVELEGARVVYQTGEWSRKNWQDEQKLPTTKLYVQTQAIECFFEHNKG